MRLFPEYSTWDRPAELEGLQLGLPSLNYDSSTNHFDDFATMDDSNTSFEVVDDFFNPIPPPSLRKVAEGLESDVYPSPSLPFTCLSVVHTSYSYLVLRFLPDLPSYKTQYMFSLRNLNMDKAEGSDAYPSQRPDTRGDSSSKNER